MPIALLATLLGAALVVGVDRALPGVFGLEVIPFEVPLGTITPAPPEDALLAQLVALHLLVAVAGGAVAASIAPRGTKMLAAAGVAFLGSVAAGYTGVFAPVGPDWFHAMHFAAVVLGPCIGGNLRLRGRAEPEPIPAPIDGPRTTDPVPTPAPAREREAAPAEDEREKAENDAREPVLDDAGPLPEPA